MTLRLDYSNMMVQPGGIPEKLWSDSAALFSGAHAGVEKLRSSETVGFIDLPSDERLIGQVTDFAAKVHGRFGDVVILGIGGSARLPARWVLQRSTFRQTSAGGSAFSLPSAHCPRRSSG